MQRHSCDTKPKPNQRRNLWCWSTLYRTILSCIDESFHNERGKAHISLTDVCGICLACNLTSHILSVTSYRPSGRFLSTQDRQTVVRHSGGRHWQVKNPNIHQIFEGCQFIPKRRRSLTHFPHLQKISQLWFFCVWWSALGAPELTAAARWHGL